MVHKTTKFNNVKNFFKKDIHDGSPPSVSFINLFRFSTCKEKIILALGLLASSINGIGATFNALNFCAFSDALIVYGSLNETMQSDKDTLKDAVVRFAINDGLIVVAYLIFKYIALTTFNYAACTQVLRIRGLLFKSALNWDISWYDLHESGELASRINEDLTRLEDGIGEKVPIYFQVIVNFISSVAIAFYYGWELALICIIPAPIVLGSMMFMASNTVKYTKQGINAYAQAGVIAEEVFSAIRTVHAFDGKEKEVERYKINLANAKKVIQKREIFSALLNACQWLFLFAMNALGCWYGVRLIVKQRHWDPEDITYTTGNMLLIFYTMCVSTWHLGMSSMYLETFAAAKASGARVFHLIRQTAIIDPSKNQGIRPTSCLGNISFQNIYFQYPSRPDVKILQGFNLTIERGEVIAMVGHSGCGKSTCIQLIQRFYDPNEGAIYLDGIEIKSLNVNWLRERIGVVGQEPVLFGTTIYENIRYGREDATQEDIEEAAKISNAHHFIKKLPQGYNTLVGERGAQLSGGQKQRIAIARAIVRNPTILLLDEATSALDTKSEAQVQDALERASKGRTTIIVAHRLSTVRNADKIVVIDKGAVVEIGSHNELMLKQNFYYNLITNQLNREIENDEIIKPRLLITDLDDDDEEEVVHNKEQVNEKIAKEPDVSKKKASTLDLLKLHPSDWPYILLGSISAFAFGIMLPLSALFLGGTLGIFSSTDDDYIITRINFFSICWAVAGILIAIGVFFQFYLLGMAGESLTEYIREITFRAMLNQEIAWFDDKSNGTGMLCARLSGDAAAVQQATGTRIGNSLMGLGLVITASVIAIIYNWTMAVIALFCLPVVLGTMWIEKRIRHNENAKKVIALGTSTKLAVEVFSNIRTVVSLGREKLFYNKYMELLNPAAKHQKTNTHIRGISYAISSTASTIAFIPVMGYGGYLTWNDDIFYADAITTARALVLTTIIITNTMAYTPNIERGLTAAANIFALLKRTPKISDTNQIYRNLVCATQGNVDFTSVEFSYPTNPNAQILRGLNLNIAQGQNIALVGSSGCGKSTCIQLLQRFYDVDSGKVTLDGKDIRTTMLRNLRAQLGIVSQEAALFNRTIGENIAYGDNTRKPELFEIIEAAKKANIHNFIASLPLGYDTKVGEKGTQLSGGQKQRIAIARALIRNPKILLLDEATSALDVESEKVVQEALDVAKKGRTCITIAHRLTTIMDVDVIYVFDAGQIVESGSHKELLELKGAYYALHKSQNCHK